MPIEDSLDHDNKLWHRETLVGANRQIDRLLNIAREQKERIADLEARLERATRPAPKKGRK